MRFLSNERCTHWDKKGKTSASLWVATILKKEQTSHRIGQKLPVEFFAFPVQRGPKGDLEELDSPSSPPDKFGYLTVYLSKDPLENL